MNTDRFFTIGQTHSICQDYAVAGSIPSVRAFAVVSDGCSSSANTDFGSRFLCRTAVRALTLFEDNLDFVWVANEAELAARMLYLSTESIDATLLIAFEVPGGVTVRAMGDGVVVGVRRDKSYVAHVINFPSGAPMYPSYWAGAGQNRIERYTTEFGTQRFVTSIESKAGEVCWEVVDDIPPINAEGNPIPVWLTFKQEEFELVLLFSDGILSFLRPTGSTTSKASEPVPLADILPMLLDFRGMSGEFITRQVKWWLKDRARIGWHHTDDLAVAGIHL